MSALKPRRQMPFEPKRGQGYAPESLTAGVNTSICGPWYWNGAAWEDLQLLKQAAAAKQRGGISEGFLEER